MSGPIGIDLFCGLGGWTEGLLAEGYYVVGFDNEQHVYGEHHYPAQLVLQDVLTIHGSQFRNAALIVASPPCQEYSYMAMPWTRAKQIAKALCGEGEFPESYRGSRTIEELNALFDACFRIQREASEAAGRHIPLVVENVKGAQPWVGPAKWHYGSYYLWGDVPALMPMTEKRHHKIESPHLWLRDPTRAGGKYAPQYVPDTAKGVGGSWLGKDWCGGYGGGFGWDCSPMRRNSSKSKTRKAASARIAKIPFTLARHIAHVYRPAEIRGAA